MSERRLTDDINSTPIYQLHVFKVRDWTFPELSSGAVYTHVALGHFTVVSKHT